MLSSPFHAIFCHFGGLRRLPAKPGGHSKVHADETALDRGVFQQLQTAEEPARNANKEGVDLLLAESGSQEFWYHIRHQVGVGSFRSVGSRVGASAPSNNLLRRAAWPAEPNGNSVRYGGITGSYFALAMPVCFMNRGLIFDLIRLEK